MKKWFAMLAGIAVMSFSACGTAGSSSGTPASAVSLTGQALPAEDSASGAYTAQDVRNLQDYLLHKPVQEDFAGKNYDLNGDGCWDVFDLGLMKRAAAQDIPAPAGSDTLVIYFSRTGNTEKIASYLTELADADSYVIEAAVPYSDADIRYQDNTCRANQEQNDKSARPEIADPIASIDSYDTVFLGYPIWWGQEPRIIDTFLESYDFSDKTVIPFCTSASSGISTSEQNIAELVPIGNQLPGRRFSAGASREDVKAWFDTLPLGEETEENKMTVTVNGKELKATLADTAAAAELAEKLKNGPVTVTLNEYGGFEKVGKLPWSLTRTDASTETQAGDIMLYQGDQMTIFYHANTWSYTKLGSLDAVTQEELAELFGDGAVTVTLS